MTPLTNTPPQSSIQARELIPTNPFLGITVFEDRTNPLSPFKEFKIGIQIDIPLYLRPIIEDIEEIFRNLFNIYD